MGDFGSLFGDFEQGFGPSPWMKGLSVGGGIFGAISGIGGMFGEKNAADQQAQLLQLQEGSEETSALTQGVQRARQVRQVMAQQTAGAVAGGVEVASPSFQAVQHSSYTQFQKDNDIEALNITLDKAKLAAQMEAMRNQEHGGLFGSLTSMAGLGMKFFGL